jgi:uncharacterized membrane protein YeaQ/YmgE (transglycosylase-associated protein family)
MGILWWVLVGLVAGGLARFIMPGRTPMGCLLTVLIGIGGALLGGFIGAQLGFGDFTGFNIRSMFLAVLGSILLLAVYRGLQRS